MNRVHLKHDDNESLLSWHYHDEPGYPPIMVCSNGHLGSIGKRHSIDPDGTVNPSVVCHVEGCSFHEFVILDSYYQEAQP